MTAIEKLAGELAGWTVAKVLPCQRVESLFTLELTKDGQTKQIDLFATDLGWWTGVTTTNHDWFPVSNGTKFCTACDINDFHPRASEPCKMKPQEWPEHVWFDFGGTARICKACNIFEDAPQAVAVCPNTPQS